MRRSLVLAGVALATGLGVTGCHAEKEPTDRYVRAVRHNADRASRAHARHRPARRREWRERIEPRPIRDDVFRDVPMLGRRHRPAKGGCVTVHPGGSNRGIEVRCAKRSGDDIRRSYETFPDGLEPDGPAPEGPAPEGPALGGSAPEGSGSD